MRICVFLLPNSMPLTVHLCLLVATCVLVILLCSRSCLGMSQYQYCMSDKFACAGVEFSYPFGKHGSGCGDPEFQLVGCDDQSGHPLLNISGEEYRILFHWDHRMIILNDNLYGGKCNLSGYYSPFWWPGSHFQISAEAYTNITLSRQCNKAEVYQLGNLILCGKNWFYNIQKPEEGARFCETYLQILIKKEDLQFNESIRDPNFLRSGLEIEWHPDQKRDLSCGDCSKSKGRCGYAIWESTTFICHCPDGTSHPDKCPGRGKPKTAIVIGCSFGVTVLIAAAILCLTFYRKRPKQPPPPRSSIAKVETFLQEYAYEMPTRYSQFELKNITNNYAEKLGEGGFGVVYKGKLWNGTLVAVKLLDRHRHSESTQFMNEVATIGRLHHVNLIRLLGYCFESPTSALVYEYMVNGSLEKFIFAENGGGLRWKQLHSIALGAARGIAYLHQDCDKRIIHFDIKPHNILLDAEFTPKVSDFGLAKLCGKADDHISVTAVRGTPGYVAPEVCYRHMGPVTDKSDVYSFGMLLLEIVGGRKNIDVHESRSSRLYFPEWAFKMLQNEELGMRLRAGREGKIEGEDDENEELGIRLGRGREGEDEEQVKRLIKIGLWCIQHNSRDRPCMSRVIQMLEGNGDDVSNPPWPFYPLAAPQRPLSSLKESSCSI